MKSNILKALLILTAVIMMAGTSVADTSGFSIDPTLIGVGARPLGMGKAYVAVAEDADTIFMNPAGLGTIKSIKLMSMYSSLMSDVNYYVLSGAIPLEIGALGLGAVSSRVDNIWILNSGAINSTHNPTSLSYGNYSNSVYFLSYGVALDKIIAPAKNIYIGANVKYFDQAAGGTTDADAGNGRGMDIDLGALYTPNKWLSLGVNYQNALPASMGGTIVYKSGISESVPSVTKLGAKINVMGDKSEAIITSAYKLKLAMDTDLFASETNKPSATHIGAEFWPNGSLALRLGMDQDPTPSTVDNTQGRNLTCGVGIRVRGIAFDYAYHPYSQIGENNTHYFSISYVGEDKSEKDVYIFNLKPNDKTITRKEQADVSGTVEGKVASVRINGNVVDVKKDQKGERGFSLPVDLKVGKNLIVVEALDVAKRPLETRNIRVLRLETFGDVDENYWADKPIEYCATAGLVQGYSGDVFKPEKTLNRAELATLLVKLQDVDVTAYKGRNTYPDLSSRHWSKQNVEAATATGLVTGYPDGTFRADNSITRAEGIAVAVRFDNMPLAQVKEKPYSDVNQKHWAAVAIETAKEKGMLDNFVKTDRYYPNKGLTRGEAVEVLSKTEHGKTKIDELLDWTKGYGLISAVNMPKKN